MNDLFEGMTTETDVICPPLKRKRQRRRAGVVKVPMTMEKADAIRQKHRTTTLNQTEIAKIFGIDQGRVSKIINNLWYPEQTRH